MVFRDSLIHFGQTVSIIQSKCPIAMMYIHMHVPVIFVIVEGLNYGKLFDITIYTILSTVCFFRHM